MTDCILCQRPLSETTVPQFLLHEEADDCLVRITDKFGVSLDDDYEVVGEDIFSRKELEEEVAAYSPTWMTTEEALKQIFAEVGLDRLGGRSTGSGWSNVSLFQKCAYAWKRTYLDSNEHGGLLLGEPVPLAVGSLVHTYLALHYQRMIIGDYPLSPDDVNQRVIELGCNPEAVQESWRLFKAYRLFYKNERVEPLAVEANFVDPRTGHSCRYDMIAYFPDEAIGRLSGTYGVEHKCLVAGSKVFDPKRGHHLSIEEFSGDVLAVTADGSLVAAPALRPESNGVQDTFRLVTDHGRVLEGNAHHPIDTLKGWRGLGALTSDDWVAVPRRLAAPFAEKQYSDAAVRLAGYLLGDGSFGDTIRFSKGHAGVRREVVSCAALCGWPIAERDGKTRVDYIEFTGKRNEGIYAFLDDLGLRHLTAERKFIPDSFSLADSQVPLLVGALWDTDGCIDVFYENGFAKPRIAFVSRSEALAFNVFHLLDRLGLEASVRASSVEYRGERQAVWTTKVVGRRSKRAFCQAVADGLILAVRLIDAAREALTEIHDVDDEAVPTAWIRQRVDLAKVDARLRLAIRSSRSMGLGTLRKFSSKLAEAYENLPVRWERVESLLASGRAEVFNLEVPGPHTFVANGIVTHNTASRFDQNTLEGWVGDGEILGQIDIWQRLKLDRRFGPLRGVLINLIGKQKLPEFHRTVAAPTAFAIDQHRRDLYQWNAKIQLAKASKVFERSRANCIHRFGRCQWWDHCNLGED